MLVCLFACPSVRPFVRSFVRSLFACLSGAVLLLRPWGVWMAAGYDIQIDTKRKYGLVQDCSNVERAVGKALAAADAEHAQEMREKVSYPRPQRRTPPMLALCRESDRYVHLAGNGAHAGHP